MTNTELTDVCAAFEAWRKACVKRQSIPDQLWQKAITLLDNYPITLVAKKLRLNTGHLRQKQHAFNQQKTKIEAQQNTPFIELNQFLPNQSTISDIEPSTVEMKIERRDGTRLTLSLNSSQVDTVRNLVTAFIQS